MPRLPLLLAATLVAAPLSALATPPMPAQAYSDRLSRLDDLRRRAALRAAINDSGIKCGRVTADRLVGPYRNLVMWHVRCEPARDVGFFVGPDASVQVRPCADLAQLKLPACPAWKP